MPTIGEPPSALPYEVREAAIRVCGTAFWYRDPLRAFFLAAGVPAAVYDRFADEPKFKIARHVFAELDRLGEEGALIQRRPVTELCKLRKLPDENVPDRDVGLGALRELKELAIKQRVIVAEEVDQAGRRVQDARARQAAVMERAQRVDALRRRFMEMAVGGAADRQSRGYDLEDLLAELFTLNEIPYRCPYRIGNEQIDGHFPFRGFDYLVESRWRQDPPTESDLIAFKRKVDKKITSTRGLFVTMVQPRDEVVTEFMRAGPSNIILMDGADLMLILEGQVSLIDALDFKIQKAAQEGVIFFSLSRRFG